MRDTALTQAQTTQLVAADGDLVEEWLAHCRDVDLAAPATVDAYRQGLAAFTAWLHETGNAGAVTPPVVVDFRGWPLQQRYSPQTVNLRLAAVRSCYRWAVGAGRLADAGLLRHRPAGLPRSGHRPAAGLRPAHGQRRGGGGGAG